MMMRLFPELFATQRIRPVQHYPDVLLANELNSQPLTVEHGAPLRLIAPKHYGYKSVKYLCRMEYKLENTGYRV